MPSIQFPRKRPRKSRQGDVKKSEEANERCVCFVTSLSAADAAAAGDNFTSGACIGITGWEIATSSKPRREEKDGRLSGTHKA